MTSVMPSTSSACASWPSSPATASLPLAERPAAHPERHIKASRPGEAVQMEAGLRSSFPARAGRLREELRRFLRYYNTDRAHTGRLTTGRTPEEALGAAKMVSRYAISREKTLWGCARARPCSEGVSVRSTPDPSLATDNPLAYSLNSVHTSRRLIDRTVLYRSRQPRTRHLDRNCLDTTSSAPGGPRRIEFLGGAHVQRSAIRSAQHTREGDPVRSDIDSIQHASPLSDPDELHPIFERHPNCSLLVQAHAIWAGL